MFQSPPEETTAAVEAALHEGYRHIDTAAAYGNEREVGEAVAASGLEHADVFLETKIWTSDHGYDETLAHPPPGPARRLRPRHPGRLTMEYRPLGRSGVQVSKLCLGTMMFGAWGNTDHDESIRIVHSADVYSAGESEETARGPRRSSVRARMTLEAGPPSGVTVGSR